MVHIGTLSSDTSQQSLLKSNCSSVLPLAAVSSDVSTMDLAESPDIEGTVGVLTTVSNAIIELLIPQNQTLVVACAAIYGSSSAQKIKYLSKPLFLEFQRDRGFFYLFISKILYNDKARII